MSRRATPALALALCSAALSLAAAAPPAGDRNLPAGAKPSLGRDAAGRQTTDGDVDTSFGAGGMATWEAFGAVRLQDITSRQDLLIAVGGYDHAGGDPHLHWWSVDGDGAIVPDHFCEGQTSDIFPLSFGASSEARVGIVDRQGRLVVGGWMKQLGSTGQKRPLVARFDLGSAGCALDATFASNGWELYDDESFCVAASCEVLGLAEVAVETGAVASQRLVALVRAASGGLGASRIFLVRLTPTGALDIAFGGNGWVEVQHPHPTHPTLFPEAALAIDARGRLYVAFTHSDPADALDLDVGVMRYSAAGVRDTSFGASGLLGVTNNPPGPDIWDSRAHEIEVGPGGHLVVTLRAVGPETRSYSYLYAANGGPILGLRNWQNTPPPSAVAQGDGRFVEAGRMPFFGGDFDARRYTPDDPETLDSSFGDGGVAVYHLQPEWGPPHLVKVHLWHGRLVYGGTRQPPAFTQSFLLRATNAYVFADGFEGGTLAPWGGGEPD